MSGWRGHLFAGFFLSGIILAIVNNFHLMSLTLFDYPIIAFTIWLGSLWPDIDTPMGTMRRIVAKVVLGTIVLLVVVYLIQYFAFPPADIAMIIGVAVLGILYYSLLFISHRSIIHSLLALAVFSLPIFVYRLEFGVMFAFSYFIHLLLDNEISLK